MNQKPKIPEVDTAIHIIKGAIVKILHANLTVSIECQKKNEGRIAVQWDKGLISNEQMKEIEQLTNKKREENLDVRVNIMNRIEAENKYKNNLVNETYIYDKYPVPNSITEVNIVEIENWNVNCCSGVHLKKTGEVRPIKILRQNYRENKKELEFVFELTNDLNNPIPTTAKDKKLAKKKINQQQQQKQESQNENKINNDNILIITNELLNDIFKTMKLKNIEISEEKEKEIEKLLKPKIEGRLNLLKNISYTKGFLCTKN
jgi:alanyl-tRNA synthetase